MWYDYYLRINANQTRIKHELIRCSEMQEDGNTMQYEAVRWWWGINTIVLRCNENTTRTNRNLHEPMRTCAIQYDNAIVAHRIATYWVAADRWQTPVRMYNESIRMYEDEMRTNRNWHELIRPSTMQYDAIRIDFDLQGQYECFGHFKTFILAYELIRKLPQTNVRSFESIPCCAMCNECQFVLVRRQSLQQWDGGITNMV